MSSVLTSRFCTLQPNFVEAYELQRSATGAERDFAGVAHPVGPAFGLRDVLFFGDLHVVGIEFYLELPVHVAPEEVNLDLVAFLIRYSLLPAGARADVYELERIVADLEIDLTGVVHLPGSLVYLIHRTTTGGGPGGSRRALLGGSGALRGGRALRSRRALR